MHDFLRQFVSAHASIEDLAAWAEQVMQAPPHFVIGDGYLQRWYILPRNPHHNVYLHRTLKSDDDRALHDHPWANTSIILSGGYLEVMPGASVQRRAGDIIHRRATDRHRLVMVDGEPTVSLFITGPNERDWGFWCGPNGDRFVHWRDFTDPNDSSKNGPGCGELGNAAQP